MLITDSGPLTPSMCHVTQVLGINRPESVIVDLIAEIDRDGNGVLDFAEYCLMMMSLPRRSVLDVIADPPTNAAISHSLPLPLTLYVFNVFASYSLLQVWCAC